MALAPAASQDALIYHLRFPETTLHDGRWAYDTANSASYYPAATGTLYVAALAVDPQGISAQLVHFGFFVLSSAAAAAIARRLGAASGRTAALLFAAVPCAGVVAGWAWADLSSPLHDRCRRVGGSRRPVCDRTDPRRSRGIDQIHRAARLSPDSARGRRRGSARGT